MNVRLEIQSSDLIHEPLTTTAFSEEDPVNIGAVTQPLGGLENGTQRLSITEVAGKQVDEALRKGPTLFDDLVVGERTVEVLAPVREVAQAFSTRVAGLKRNASSACSTRLAVKSWAEKPALKWPR